MTSETETLYSVQRTGTVGQPHSTALSKILKLMFSFIIVIILK